MPSVASRRCLLLGSPEVAVTAARALTSAGHEVVGVVTRPDARRGRGGALSATPVKRWALESGVPVFDGTEAALDGIDTEGLIGVVVAYGRLISPEALSRVPMVNIHFSLLPRWRGAAPVERAIMAGDTVTGVCIMHVEEGLDTGAVLASREIAIMDDDTTATLTARLGAIGAQLLVEVMAAEIGPGVPQQGEATYARKIEGRERTLDWSEPAVHLERVVRALGPGTVIGEARIKILNARVVEGASSRSEGAPGTLLRDGTVICGSGALRLTMVQPAGKAPMPAAAWMTGLRWSPGMAFVSVP